MKQSFIGIEMLKRAGDARLFLSDESKQQIAAFLRDRMNEDGGFRGRTEKSDLYYTLFGIQCLLALQQPFPPEPVQQYVGSFSDGQSLDFVHLCCLAQAKALVLGVNRSGATEIEKAIIGRIEQYKTSDGGYGVMKGAERGSVYGCFLAALAYESCTRELPNPAKIVECLAGLKSSDGGYANEPGLAGGTTTATAAACIILSAFGQSVASSVGDWLMARCDDKGGFGASPAAPIPDLLSTATALDALAVMKRPLGKSSVDFVETLWDEGGGFCGSWADPLPDCEYTFYALLALGSAQQGAL